MTFLHPDRATAPYAIQAGIFGADFDEIIAGFRGTGIRMGCALTPNGLSVDIAAGVVFIDGKLIPVAAQTVGPVTPAGGTAYRWYLVEVNTSGVGSVKAGNPSNWDENVSPVKPRPTAARCVLGDVFVSPAAAGLFIADITPRGIPFLRPPVRHFHIREWGVTPTSTPTAIAAAFNTAIPWIAANVPGGTLVIDPGTWIVNASVVLMSNVNVEGADLMNSVLKLVNNASNTDPTKVVYVIGGPAAGQELYGVVVRNFTVDGNRYNQTNFSITAGGTNGIDLGGSGYRHNIRLEDLRVLRAWNYGVGNSGLGRKEFIWYKRVYVENAGGDGFDNRGAVPWDRHLYMEDCTVDGFGFNDGYSSTAFEMRGCWNLINPRVEFIQRFTHAGVRFHGGDGLDGTGNRYGAMYCQAVGASVALTGHAKYYGVVGTDPSTQGRPAAQITGLVTPRPTPVVLGSFGSQPGSPASSFIFTPPGAGNTWWRLPRPWRPVEMCVVSNCLTGVAPVPNIPTLWGLIWVEHKTVTLFNTRMTIFRAMPGFCPTTPTAGSHFSAVDAHDWSQATGVAPNTQPNTPSTPLHSAYPVDAATFTISFSGAAALQQFCQLGIVEIDYGSTYCGKIATATGGNWTVDYGAHAKDAYVQTVALGLGGSNATAAPSIPLAALQSYETNPASTGLDGGIDPGGTKIENTTAVWFFNRQTASQVLTPSPNTGTALNQRVLQQQTAGRMLTMIASLGPGPDSSPSGTHTGAVADYLMIAHEYRTGRPVPGTPPSP